MRIQADNLAELDEAIETHCANGWKLVAASGSTDGQCHAEFDLPAGQDHPAISAAAVELRKLGVSYATAKPILRRVFNAGKGAGA